MTPCRSSLVMAAAISTSFCNWPGRRAHLAMDIDDTLRGRALRSGHGGKAGANFVSVGSSGIAAQQRSVDLRAEAARAPEASATLFFRARPMPSALPPPRPSNDRRDALCSFSARRDRQERRGRPSWPDRASGKSSDSRGPEDHRPACVLQAPESKSPRARSSWQPPKPCSKTIVFEPAPRSAA